MEAFFRGWLFEKQLISLLLKNEISLVEPYIHDYNEFKQTGCSNLSSKLECFLHEQERLVSFEEIKEKMEQLKESLLLLEPVGSVENKNGASNGFCEKSELIKIGYGGKEF